MSTFVLEYPGVNNCRTYPSIYGSPEQYNRKKGKWIYCLHPKWTNENDNVRRACDRANNTLNDALEDNFNETIHVWGTHNKELAKEFNVVIDSFSCIFIAVDKGEILGKIDSANDEIVSDWVSKIFKKKREVNEIKEPIKDITPVISVEPAPFMSKFRKLF